MLSARGVVFDLDGTLIDSLPDIAGHLNAALADEGLATYEESQVRKWVGSGAAVLVQRAVSGEARVQAVLERFRTHYRAAPYARTQVFAGIGAMLDKLAGTPIAILSNKPHDLVQVISKALLGNWPFLEIVGERPGIPRKPDPTALLAIATALAVPPGACAMVGDSEIDVATAKAAGMTSVAVTWGLVERRVLIAAGADHVVETPAELAALLG